MCIERRSRHASPHQPRPSHRATRRYDDIAPAREVSFPSRPPGGLRLVGRITEGIGPWSCPTTRMRPESTLTLTDFRSLDSVCGTGVFWCLRAPTPCRDPARRPVRRHPACHPWQKCIFGSRGGLAMTDQGGSADKRTFFSDNALKLGVFCLNVSGGMMLSGAAK